MKWVSAANLALLLTVLGTLVLIVAPDSHAQFCRGFVTGLFSPVPIAVEEQ